MTSTAAASAKWTRLNHLAGEPGRLAIGIGANNSYSYFS